MDDATGVLMAMYRAMRAHFGDQHWWPGESPLEVCVGAILTQNTQWTNVEKAMANLQAAEGMSVTALDEMSHDDLAELIRPAGYFNLKARYLKNLFAHVRAAGFDAVEGFLARPALELRADLLTVNGIGPETADSIVLYAAGKPSFVVDAYTRRILARHRLIAPEDRYDTVKALFERSLPRRTALWNDYHAQLVAVGNQFCKKARPHCDDCPLAPFPHDATLLRDKRSVKVAPKASAKKTAKKAAPKANPVKKAAASRHPFKGTSKVNSMGSAKVVVTRRDQGTDIIPLSQAEKKALNRHEAVIEKDMVGFVAVGEALKQINEGRLYRETHDTFDEYCTKRWEFARQRAYQLINAATAAENVYNCLQIRPTRESHVRPLIGLKPEIQIQVWETATAQAKADDRRITAELVKGIRDDIRADRESIGQFNRTNEHIDWAKWSWNPVTGCQADCVYCFGRDIANLHKHHFPKGFKPHLRTERLAIPREMEKLKLSEKDKDIPGIRDVFTCSMADLFGDWVKQAWIDKVMAAVREAPSWNFLFLTKNPERLTTIDWPDNAWAGATVDCRARVQPTIAAMKNVKAKVRFISCEPLLEEVKFRSLKCIDWLIIGARSKTTKVSEFQPKVAWVNSLIAKAHEGGCKVYCKPNLRWSMHEYPRPEQT